MPARLSQGAPVGPEPTWRCPECHTVQARAARCWRCAKPVYTCETCRLYQPSVATDLGTCADDLSGPLVSARDSCPCWQSRTTPASATERPGLGGLFPELEPEATDANVGRPRRVRGDQPEPSASSIRRAPDRLARSDVGASRRPLRPDIQHAGRAAWVASDEDRLVDAPTIEPGKRLTTEVQRRRRRWFR